MMSIRSLADFNRSSLGGDGDWLTPPPSPPRPQTPGRHDERGMGTFNWPPARTSTWPYTRTFSRPRTPELADRRKDARVKAGPFESRRVDPLALPPYGGPHYVIGSGSWPCAGSCRRAGRLGCWASPLPGLRQLLTRQAPAAEVPVQTRGPSPARHASVNGLVLRLRTRTGRSRRRRGSARCT
jgi:hypothetical protein